MVKRVVAALCAQAVGAGQYGGQALHHIADFIRFAGQHRDDIGDFNRAVIGGPAVIIGDHREASVA